MAAAARSPGRLRNAASAKSPLGTLGRVGRAPGRRRGRGHQLLRELGHDVVDGVPDYTRLSGGWNVTARYLRGIHDDVVTVAHPERLERRTRSMARAGWLVSDRRIAGLRSGEPALTGRVNSIFDDVDVVLTPGTPMGPPLIGAYDRRGALVTLTAVMRSSPFQAIFNATGQPAAVVPWGADDDGLPTSVQLVGRPADEATLLALGTQVESAHPWAGRRPTGP